MCHPGYALKVPTALKATIELEHSAPKHLMYCQPTYAMHSDSWLRHPLVVLLYVRLQVDVLLQAPMWEDQQHMSLDRLQGTRVIAPTIVWLFGQLEIT